ncbi:MAG: twin-arginine translocase TatA/TatE family subunit [Aphanocapsa lilacina HA4352-LM1]|jgi:sec-independent protein translocase protein TatA|uniref:Sec-independent protein translocase protein TatA n=1 Tax=Gloeobacter morelensis MG652769 TaxID=2781736 RepID=A0ABY3PHK5_9CYAN|nr:twin-arginine translocase TatA/TatE family subunit [Gloeobacter morelensis]MBW4699140.1 twin-arginine translocase TatA/TatE family subunit [Aphanocapsa lilacina HA4352-LM1]UFP93125.1 twin-arginine translocase TatA/TatE family subunit [Gloeobacter morelensis MG652769]
MPFGLGLPEILVIGVIALLIFGPKKLPEMGSALGKAIRGFKSGVSDEPAPQQSASKETTPNPPQSLPSGKDS